MLKVNLIIILASILSGCATSMYGTRFPVPPQLQQGTDMKVEFTDSEYSYSNYDKGVKYFWTEQPKWSEVVKVKRNLSASVDAQELAQRPYVWVRKTANTPYIGLRKTAGFLNILITTIPSGSECYMKKFSLRQESYEDVSRNPAALQELKSAFGVMELQDGNESEVKIDCSDFDKIVARNVRTKRSE